MEKELLSKGLLQNAKKIYAVAGEKMESARLLKDHGKFNKQYIATGKIDRELGKYLGALYDERQGADYDFFLQSSETDTLNAIEKAEKIIFAVKKYVEREYSMDLE